ncbi:transglutaminase-like domain-containing protein [Myxococcus sp. AS-1-15]|uniref:transglutaminase-like domain-containing protein n=1 Tax=Myxococcus sp. AS-1-15 TaxID=2874600 RepID=UPI001CBE40D3|nr:transglutaminase-like domain-containing protein [Myxococcus sp. AS-1-15]MBZ4394397.1 transglutaminase-like domain-containing protein [Myxococcus sp. AS-1-15]BDT37063.1 transglutaminase-like domain-containing protein [Myxococcus sp. MH1]
MSTSAGLKTALKLLLAGFTLTSVLCCLGVGMVGHLVDTKAPAVEPGLPPSADVVDLGLVLIPADTSPSRARTYDWNTEGLRPPGSRLGYGLGELLDAWLEDQHKVLGRRLRYRSLGQERFTYQPPSGCSADMRCIYEELMRGNAGPVEALGERFMVTIRERGLDSQQAARLILGFVQRIQYEVPTDEPFGIIPPALVPARNRGDCDSKALLAVMLLRQVGIEAVMLYSDPLAHAAVGVGLPGTGTRLRHGGRSYQYAEVTAEGWPPGMIPPKYDKPRLWRVMPLDAVTSG